MAIGFKRVALCGILLVSLGFLTWRQTAEYHNLFALYTATLQKNPGCWMAHYNLGIVLSEQGERGSGDRSLSGEPLTCGLITRRRITTWAGFWLRKVSLTTQLPITKEPLRLIPLMQKHKTILVLRFSGLGALMTRLPIIRKRSKSGPTMPRPHATLRTRL